MLGCRVRQVNRPVLRNRGSFAAVPKSGESGTNDSALVATNDRSLSELPRDEMRRLFSASNTVVCRLTASIEAMEQRVKLRESGVSQRDYVARVAELNTILDRAQLENFTITNENRPLTDVAHELLVKAGWISN
jgi:CRP-like cAMP-binding protein